MPGGDGGKGEGLDAHIAGATGGELDGKGLDLRHGQALGVVGTEGADEAPVAAIGGDVVVDGLGEENPGEGEVEEIELDLADFVAATEVDDGIESVAPEA